MDNRIIFLLGYLCTLVAAVVLLHLMSAGELNALPENFGEQVFRPFSTLEKFLGFGS